MNSGHYSVTFYGGNTHQGTNKRGGEKHIASGARDEPCDDLRVEAREACKVGVDGDDCCGGDSAAYRVGYYQK